MHITVDDFSTFKGKTLRNEHIIQFNINMRLRTISMKFIETDAYFVYRPNCASCRILYRMFGNEIINADFCLSQPL
jgi:hypothetical protein